MVNSGVSRKRRNADGFGDELIICTFVVKEGTHCIDEDHCQAVDLVAYTALWKRLS